LIGTAIRDAGARSPGGRIVDRGVWVPEGDPRTALRRGRLPVTLISNRWNGRFALLRFSVGRRKEYWHLRQVSSPDAGDRLPGAVAAPLPLRVGAQYATPVRRAPAGPGWIHEVRRDGLRLLATVEEGRVRLFAPQRPAWPRRLRLLARELSSLPVRSAILDGDVVALTQRGTSSRDLLREAAARQSWGDLFYFVFDLLYLDGSDLRDVPLVERKRRLAGLLAEAGRSPHLQFAEHVDGSGDLVARHVRELSLEGLVSRRARSPYRAGRGSDWVRLRCRPRRKAARAAQRET
jgi:bifunctional non-homologous end joining protein LigD